jgi:transposase
MAQHLDHQLRTSIVAWRLKQHRSIKEIKTLAGCSEHTIYQVLRLHRDYGVVHNPVACPRGRHRALLTSDINYLQSLLNANPSLYLDELQAQLAEVLDVEVSLATISRALRHLALTQKSLSKEALEKDELLRATWQAAYGDMPSNFFFWLDESGVDDMTNQWRNGWAPLGRACVHCATFLRGQRYSILPTLTVDGIVALDIFEGSVNKDKS